MENIASFIERIVASSMQYSFHNMRAYYAQRTYRSFIEEEFWQMSQECPKNTENRAGVIWLKHKC